MHDDDRRMLQAINEHCRAEAERREGARSAEDAIPIAELGGVGGDAFLNFDGAEAW